jgi:hypothetical protein
MRIYIDTSAPRKFATTWPEGILKGLLLGLLITLVGAMAGKTRD